MKIVFTGVCHADLVQSLYNELQPEEAVCVGRLIKTDNPLPEIAPYRFEVKDAKQAASQFANESLDIVWLGNTDDNALAFEESAWMPKIKTGGRLICQHIYRTGEPVQLTQPYPDNWYLIKA